MLSPRPIEDDPSLLPLVQSVESLASAPIEGLSEPIKARQRADLLTLATSMNASSSTPETPKHAWFSSRALVFASVVAVAVLILNVSISAWPREKQALLTRLIVPVAETAHAFTLEPMSSAPGGMDTTSGWRLQANVPVSQAALQKAITLEPSAEVRVEQEGNAWRIVPEKPLKQNTVYRVELAAALLSDKAVEVPYAYSWAHQTAGDFRVEALTPAPLSGGVPANTAIEITFSHGGFAKPDTFFHLEPAVNGRFETRDRTLIFLPEKPLALGRVYRVRLDAGFGIEGASEMKLEKPLTFSFQIGEQDEGIPVPDGARALYLPIEQQMRVGMPVRVMVPDDFEASLPFSVDLFSLSADEATNYLKLRQGVLGSYWWNSAMNADVQAFLGEKKSSTSLKNLVRISRAGPYGSQEAFLELPPQSAPGFWLARVQAKGFFEEYTLVQVSNVATHVVADESKVVVWAVDPHTKQPISGATVHVNASEGITDLAGIATVPLPEGASVKPLMDREPVAMRITKGNDQLIQLLSVQQYGFGRLPHDPYEGNRRTWTALSLDRIVQRQDDTLSIFGLALDRGTKTAPEKLSLRLKPVRAPWSAYDRNSLTEVVLDEQEVKPDAYGRFNAAFSWKGRRVGSYSVDLVREGKTVASEWFEVRKDAKPSIKLTVTLDGEKEVVAGDTMQGSIVAAFMDGTRSVGTVIEVIATQDDVGEVYRQRLTMSALGEGRFRIPTSRPASCEVVPENAWPSGLCGNSVNLSVSARVAEGEEGESMAQDSGRIFSSPIALAGTDSSDYFGLTMPRADYQGINQLVIQGKTIASLKTRGMYDIKPDQRVNAELYRQMTREVQTGTRYNEITKRTEPVMTTQTFLEQVDSIDMLSGTDGFFSFTFTTEKTREYRVILRTSDGRGGRTAVALSPWRPYGVDGRSGVEATRAAPERDPVFRIAPTSGDVREYDYEWLKLGFQEQKEVKLLMNDADLPATVSKPLFLVAARGIQQSALAPNNRFSFVMNEATYPNASLYAVVFTDKGFITTQQFFSVKTDAFMLTVQARTDKETYAPGETAKAMVKVLDPQGKPVAKAKIAISVADKALEALYGFQYGKLLDRVYASTEDGVLVQMSSHRTLEKSSPGGAEGGGGGPGDILLNPRKNFKDQAAFLMVETNSEGEAEASFVMPDNLTTWRVHVLALATDLRAGEAIIERPVSKLLAIDASVPREVAVGDKVEIRVRTMANELSATADVTYAVEAGTLGLSPQTQTVKGRKNVYFPFTVTPAMRGEHVIKVGVQSGGLRDAMEFTLRVVESVSTKILWEQAEAKVGFTLPETVADASSVVITSKARAALIPHVQALIVQGKSSRLEAKVVARLAHDRLTALGVISESIPSFSWSDYQEGGLKPLPYSSPDLDTTLSVLASGAYTGDKVDMVTYANALLKEKVITREARIKALSVLALVGEPTLEELRTASQQNNLTFTEEAALLRGWLAIGDREAARTIYETWMKRVERKDGASTVPTNASTRDTFIATRLAAYAAFMLADDDRETLVRGLERLRTKERVYEPILEAQLLLEQLAQAPVSKASLTYRVGETVQTVDLNERVLSLTLGAEEWKRFKIEAVEGPVSVSWQRRVAGTPETTPGLSLERTYTPVAGTGTIHEGDLVRVRLKPSFPARDTFGCYEIRDTLPANARPVLNWMFVERGWWPSHESDGSVSFVACAAYQDEISYVVRLVAPGTYTARAPMMQHLESPSLAAVGTQTTLTVERNEER